MFLPRNYSNDRQVTCPLRKFVVWVKEDRQTMRKPEDEKANVDHEQCLGQFDCPSPVSKMKQQGLPLTDIGWPLIPTWLTNYIHDKMGMKLLFHSQTSMVQYFTGHVLSHTCWDQIHVSKTGTRLLIECDPVTAGLGICKHVPESRYKYECRYVWQIRNHWLEYIEENGSFIESLDLT